MLSVVTEGGKNVSTSSVITRITERGANVCYCGYPAEGDPDSVECGMQDGEADGGKPEEQREHG